MPPYGARCGLAAGIASLSPPYAVTHAPQPLRPQVQSTAAPALWRCWTRRNSIVRRHHAESAADVQSSTPSSTANSKREGLASGTAIRDTPRRSQLGRAVRPVQSQADHRQSGIRPDERDSRSDDVFKRTNFPKNGADASHRAQRSVTIFILVPGSGAAVRPFSARNSSRGRSTPCIRPASLSSVSPRRASITLMRNAR